MTTLPKSGKARGLPLRDVKWNLVIEPIWGNSGCTAPRGQTLPYTHSSGPSAARGGRTRKVAAVAERRVRASPARLGFG